MEKKLKIIYLGINSSWTQSNLALYILRTLIQGMGFKQKIREFTLQSQIMEILAMLVKEKPDVLCSSVYIWNRCYLQNLIPEVKKLFPEMQIVLGGPEAESIFGTNPVSDFRILGTGEAAYLSLAQSGFKAVDPRTEPISIRDIPFPYQESDKQNLQNKLLYYESSRGCPFSCIYCLSSLDKRKETRFDARDLKDFRRLKDEIDCLLSFAPRTIKFVDRSFNLFPDSARLIWEYVISLDCITDFHFEIYPDLLQEADIELLKKAPENRIRFEIGIQSVDNATNRICGRASNWHKCKPLIQSLCSDTCLRIHLDLLAGLPGESLNSVLNSLDEIGDVFPNEIQLGILKVLPNTLMENMARERGYLWQNTPPYQTLRTDELSIEDLVRLDQIAHLLNIYWNKAEFRDIFRKLLRKKPLSSVMGEILHAHEENNLEFHSIDKKSRIQIMSLVTQT